jgi:valyl-tRNA synthetase
LRLHIEKVEANRNFANKLWNAARFIVMKKPLSALSTPQAPLTYSPLSSLNTLNSPDRWILHRVNRLVGEVTAYLDNYDLGLAAQAIYDFVWDDYCDWYIELSKLGDGVALLPAMKTALKLLHPFMPFITEEIYQNLFPDEESIMISDWPVFRDDFVFAEAEREVELLKEVIRAIRNVRMQENVPAAKPLDVHVIAEDEEAREIFARGVDYITALAKGKAVIIEDGRSAIPEDAVSVVTSAAVIYIPLTDLVNIERERERLDKEAERLDAELRRSEAMLANPRFLEKAPPDKVDAEREKQETYKQMKEQVNLRLQQLKDLGKI